MREMTVSLLNIFTPACIEQAVTSFPPHRQNEVREGRLVTDAKDIYFPASDVICYRFLLTAVISVI
jgi:hypothetical protein